MFLCLAHIFIKYFKIKKNFFKVIIFILFIFISLLIILSRIILAAHSINQVLYGALLGLGVYAILIHIIQYHKYSSIQFYQYIKKKIVKKIYYIFHVSLLIISVLVYLLTENKDHTDINETIFNGIRCDIKPDYKRYKNGGLFQALAIMGILGAQFGIDILFILLKKNNYMINYSIIEWNKNYKIKNAFLRLIINLFSSIGIILYFIVPGNMNLLLIFIFKSSLAFFLGTAGIFSFGIYLCIKLKIANKDIYKMEALHEITAEV
jgi:membrane-associated phospholipid phosphatase